MKKLLCLISILIALNLAATQIRPDRAETIAQNIVSNHFRNHKISGRELLDAQGKELAFVFQLSPSGYLVLSAREELPPLMAFSQTDSFYAKDGGSILRELLAADLSSRLAYPPSHAENRRKWMQLERGTGHLNLTGDYLLNTSWNQTQPFNAMCPMDPVSNSRSLAGCPAIAMAQILNYLQEIHQTRFGDEDDYYHNYAGRNYIIDDDYAALGFPSFVDLNSHLDEIENCFRHGQNLSQDQRSALIFAAGTALKQVYTSQSSGTFSVNQALIAFQRFGFPHANLITDNITDPYAIMQDNILDGIPVHLAVVTPAWDAGHNVVVDGINQEGMFHLNFGWGGSYNGWYNLPQGVPYGLSVLEGAVVNLYRELKLLCFPDHLEINAGQSADLELISVYNSPMQFQDIVFGEGLEASEWQISPALPANLDAMGIMNISFSHLIPTREDTHSSFRLVFDGTWLEIPVTLNGSSNLDDPHINAAMFSVKVSPNPFTEYCEFILSSKNPNPSKLFIYNLRGQLVRVSNDLRWDGKNNKAEACPSGIYLYRVQSGSQISRGRLLKL